MGQLGGEGIIWPLTIAGQSCQAWSSENAWCQWIAPLCPAPGLAQIDPALLPPLALWSWQPWLQCLPEEQLRHFQIGIPRAGAIPEDWGPQLSLRDLDRAELSLRLVEWPVDWLLQQIQDWEAPVDPSPVPPLAISVVAGWCSLPYESVATLGIGEGVRLSGTVNLWRGEGWLFQQQPLARVRFTQAQHALIEAVMAESSEWPVVERSVELLSLPVTLVAEIGQLWLSLEQLTNLQVGAVLRGSSAFTGEVRLKANGYHLGSGQLIEVGGCWVVQINQWFVQPASFPSKVLESAAVANRVTSPESPGAPAKVADTADRSVGVPGETAVTAAAESRGNTLIGPETPNRELPAAAKQIAGTAAITAGETPVTPAAEPREGEKAGSVSAGQPAAHAATPNTANNLETAFPRTPPRPPRGPRSRTGSVARSLSKRPPPAEKP